MLSLDVHYKEYGMNVNKKTEKILARIRVITERMENQKGKDHQRMKKVQEKKEKLYKALRSICLHEKTAESGEFVGCESGLRYERWRICLQCGLRLT